MSSDPFVGKKLGNYEIVKLIGKGGMAGVYQALQPSMNRTVAIKVMADQLVADDSFIQRFKNEAQLIAHLEHAHILPVYDFGEQEGILYIVMRYLDAGTLDDRIGEKGMKIKEAVNLFGQLASALDYAHSKGVVHRDLKPSNVLIDKQNNAFLSDFGIAKSLEGSTQNLTGTGGVVGTPTYMSPEQGLGGTVDARSDIYSLGVILFEMLTGQPPFTAENPMAVMLKHINDVPPAPSNFNPAVTQAVESVVLKALAKKPEDRFATATEMADALVSATTTGTFVAVKPQAGSPPSVTVPIAAAQPSAGSQAATMPAPVVGQPQTPTAMPGGVPTYPASYPAPMPATMGGAAAVPVASGAYAEAELPPYYSISTASQWLVERLWIGTWLQAAGLSLATFLALMRLTPGDVTQNVILAIVPGIFVYGLLNAPIPGALVALGLIFLPLVAHAPLMGLLWLMGIAIAGMQMTSREMMLFGVSLIGAGTPIGWLLPLAAPWWLRNQRVAFGTALGVIFAALFALTLPSTNGSAWPTASGLLPKPEDTSAFKDMTISDFDTSYIGVFDAKVWSTWFSRPQDILDNIRKNAQALGQFFIDSKGVLLIVPASWAVAAFLSTLNRQNPSLLMRGIGIGAGAFVLIVGHIFHAWGGVIAPNLFYLLGIAIGCGVAAFLVTQWPIQAPPPPRKKEKKRAAA